MEYRVLLKFKDDTSIVEFIDYETVIGLLIQYEFVKEHCGFQTAYKINDKYINVANITDLIISSI